MCPECGEQIVPVAQPSKHVVAGILALYLINLALYGLGCLVLMQASQLYGAMPTDPMSLGIFGATIIDVVVVTRCIIRPDLLREMHRLIIDATIMFGTLQLIIGLMILSIAFIY